MIRVREGVGGTKYQVVIRRPDQTTISRTFRRRGDAQAWAQREEQKLREAKPPGPPTPSG